jgi:hypothetical protein
VTIVSYDATFSLAGSGKGKGKGSSKRPNETGSPTLAPVPAPFSPTASPSLSPPSFRPEVIFRDDLNTCFEETTLSNGETIFVGLDLEAAFSGDPLTANFLGATGLETVFINEPFVHITYVIDTSGSSTDPCDATRDILQCEKDAIIEVNNDVGAAGAVLDVALVSFASISLPADLDPLTEGVQLLAAPTDPAVAAAVSALTAFGGTRFLNATIDAINAVTLSKQNPQATDFFVVFLSDGVENTVADVTQEIADLNALGATVFSFAVGSGSSCIENLVLLAEGTGGVCTEVVDPALLGQSIRDVVIPDRELAATQISLNGTPLPLTANPPFPTEGPVGDGPFQITTGDVQLAAGTYEVCIESLSTGFGGDPSECCVGFDVVDVEF